MENEYTTPSGVRSLRKPMRWEPHPGLSELPAKGPLLQAEATLQKVGICQERFWHPGVGVGGTKHNWRD